MIKPPRKRSEESDEEFYVPVPISPEAIDPNSQAPGCSPHFWQAAKKKPSRPTGRTLKIFKPLSRRPHSTKQPGCSWPGAWGRRMP